MRILIFMIFAAVLAILIPMPLDKFLKQDESLDFVPWCSVESVEWTGFQIELRESLHKSPCAEMCIDDFKRERGKRLALKGTVEKDGLEFLIFDQIDIKGASLIVYLIEAGKPRCKFEWVQNKE